MSILRDLQLYCLLYVTLGKFICFSESWVNSNKIILLENTKSTNAVRAQVSCDPTWLVFLFIGVSQSLLLQLQLFLLLLLLLL